MKKAILIFLAGFPIISNAQITSHSHQQQIWTGYQNISRWSDHWGTLLEGQIKTQNDFLHDVEIIEKTAGLIYYGQHNTKFTTAFTHVNQYANTSAHTLTFEYRPWQMLQFKTDFSKLKLSHWLRLEERFKEQTDKSIDFSVRYRYNIFGTYPITKNALQKNGLSFAVANELYLQNGAHITNNFFDQNRFFIGLWYYVNNHDQLQFGLTKVYQIASNGTKEKTIDVIKLSYFNNID